MSVPGSGSLPQLTFADFGVGQDHVIDVHQQGKVIGIVHKDDPIRPILPHLSFSAGDRYTYLFVHGGQTHSRFENRDVGTHEIPAQVVANILGNKYGGQLVRMMVRLCTCYGNLLRPGDVETIAQSLAKALPRMTFEGYHGLVRVLANPAEIRLGLSVLWDATAIPPGPVVTGPPGNWEPITP